MFYVSYSSLLGLYGICTLPCPKKGGFVLLSIRSPAGYL